MLWGFGPVSGHSGDDAPVSAWEIAGSPRGDAGHHRQDCTGPGAGDADHRRGNTIPGPVGAANRAASSKQARCFRRWRRFACFPHFLWVLPKDYARRRASEANRPSGRLLGRRETGRARSKRKALFSPLYTKADGSFLGRCFLCPEVSYRLRSTAPVPEVFRRKSRKSGGHRGGKPKGLSVYSRALRAYPGKGRRLVNHPGRAQRSGGRLSPSTTAVARSEAERAGPTRRGLSVLPR